MLSKRSAEARETGSRASAVMHRVRLSWPLSVPPARSGWRGIRHASVTAASPVAVHLAERCAVRALKRVQPLTDQPGRGVGGVHDPEDPVRRVHLEELHENAAT